VFELLQRHGIPADDATADVRTHFGTVHGRRDQVERLLARYDNVHFHPGTFPGSADGLAAERFSFVHLDLDLVRGTTDALTFFHPRMVTGGIMIGDDYGDPGVRGAFETYFAGRPETLIGLPWNQVMIVRQKE
jgi:O-methyltransferase